MALPANVSKNITLYQATRSSYAQKNKIDNTPTLPVFANMQYIAQNVFEPLAAHFKIPNINSFFRGPDLNSAIGGAQTSQHLFGQAMDLSFTGGSFSNKDIFDYICKNLPFDQLIWEAGTDKNPEWVHVSLTQYKNRHQVLKGIRVGGKMTYEDITGCCSDSGTGSVAVPPTVPPKTFEAPKASTTGPINTFTPSDKSKAPTGSTKTSGGTVYRIETVFEHSIDLDELSIPSTAEKTPLKPEEVVSMEYPLIKVNDYIFAQSEIDYVTIDSTEFLPTIVCSVSLASDLFIAKNMPKDGDILSIAIRSKSDSLKIVRNDYVITSVHSEKKYTTVQTTPTSITFYGELFIPGLKSQVGDMSFKATSLEAMKQYAHSMNLGFATNEYDTDDKQIWLKANIAGDLFIKYVTERAWKDQNSFFDSWIDVYYNLNFVNLNLQLISSETEVDLASVLNNMDKNTYFPGNSDVKDTQITPKVFSNFPNFRSSPFYVETWRPANKSSTITFQIGTKMICETFEHNRYLYEDAAKQKYWMIPVEPIYDENKVKKSILLRGRSTQQNDPDDTDLKRANYPYVGLYEKMPWLGIQYTISNPDEDNSQWDGNHHRYYQLSKVQNLMNNKELEKLNVLVTVNGNNFNIIRGDKLPFALVRTNPIDNSMIHEQQVHEDVVDLFYSGWYIVKGFILKWSGSERGNVQSGFTEEFILTRREWPTPILIEGLKSNSNIK